MLPSGCASGERAACSVAVCQGHRWSHGVTGSQGPGAARIPPENVFGPRAGALPLLCVLSANFLPQAVSRAGATNDSDSPLSPRGSICRRKPLRLPGQEDDQGATGAQPRVPPSWVPGSSGLRLGRAGRGGSVHTSRAAPAGSWVTFGEAGPWGQGDAQMGKPLAGKPRPLRKAAGGST